MTDMTEHQDMDTVIDAAIRDAVTTWDTAMLVSVEDAAALATVSVQMVRRWIQHGHLPHVEDENGKRVSPADLPLARERAGRGHSHDQRARSSSHGQRHDTRDTDTDTAKTAPVSSSVTAQMEAIRDQWLRPLVDRIEELARENGRLEQDRDSLRVELDRMRVPSDHAPQDAPQNAMSAPPRDGAPEWAWEALRDTRDAQSPIWRRWWRRITGG